MAGAFSSFLSGVFSSSATSPSGTPTSTSGGSGGSVVERNRRVIANMATANTRYAKELQDIDTALSAERSKGSASNESKISATLKLRRKTYDNLINTDEVIRTRLEKYVDRVQIEAKDAAQLSREIDRIAAGHAPRTGGTGGSGFQRQMRMQAASQALHTISTGAGLERLPVLGNAISSGIGTGVNASLMGAGLGTSLAMGGIAALGIGAIGAMHLSYQTYEQEEALRRKMGQAGGLSGGDAAIARMRGMGLTREEIGGLGVPLAHATGDFGGFRGVYKSETAYGLGQNAIGLMGASASTGAEGSQYKMVRDAISAGMMSGLKQGRFHEMVDGVHNLVRGSTFGHTVTSEDLSSGLGYMGALGKASGFKGSQLTGLMGLVDQSIRSKSGLSGSMSFLTGYDILSREGAGVLGESGAKGRISPFDVMELQEQGYTGPKGAEMLKRRLAYYKKSAGVSDTTLFESTHGATPEIINAAKGKLEGMRMLINEDIFKGESLTGARKLSEGFLSNTLDDKAVKEAMAMGGDKQERAFEDIHESTGLQHRIAYGIEAMGRAMPGAQAGAFNRTFESLLEFGPGGGAAAAAYATPSERLALPQQFKDALTSSGVYNSVELGIGGGYSYIDQKLTRAEATQLSQTLASNAGSRANFEKLLTSMSSSPVASPSVLAAVEGVRGWMNAPTDISDYEDARIRVGPVGKSLGAEETALAAKIMLSLLDAAVAMTADPRFANFAGTVPLLTRTNPMAPITGFFDTNRELPSESLNE